MDKLLIAEKVSSSLSSIIKDNGGNSIINISMSNNMDKNLNISIQITNSIESFDSDELRKVIVDEMGRLLSVESFSFWKNILVEQKVISEETPKEEQSKEEETSKEDPSKEETSKEETPKEEQVNKNVNVD